MLGITVRPCVTVTMRGKGMGYLSRLEKNNWWRIDTVAWVAICYHLP